MPNSSGPSSNSPRSSWRRSSTTNSEREAWLNILLLLHQQQQILDQLVLAETKILVEVFAHIHPQGADPR